MVEAIEQRVLAWREGCVTGDRAQASGRGAAAWPVRGHVQRLPHLFLSFSATFLGLMQAAYDGALAYLSGRMPGAPIPHTEIAAKGHAIAEMLFAIESARAI